MAAGIMIAFTFWLIGVATIIIQTSLFPDLPKWFNRPDFLFILLVFVAYRFAWIPGIIVVFSLSWIMDVVTGTYLGFYPLVCLLLFTVLKGSTYGNPVKESTYQIPLLGIVWLAGQFLQHIIFSFGLDQIMPDWQWGEQIFNVILMMIVAIPLFALYNALFMFLVKRRQLKKAYRRTPGKPRRTARSIR